MTEGEAHKWMLAPDVKLLALLYPELPKAEANPISRDISPANVADKLVVTPHDQTPRGEISF